ncbi:MAG: hypothetical protein JSU68_02535 [Phycisphaerales bacterium]|nr:MAG: hypothetical protein JSU68_02535 [Phycisphaerales bacterium]
MKTTSSTARFATMCLFGSLLGCAGCEGFVDLINQSLINSASQGQPFADANTPNTSSETINGMPALVYDVEIRGDAQGENGGYFEREGIVYVLSTIGNVVEVLIESGQPETSADLGAFLFATHTDLYQGTNPQTASGIDLAVVDYSERDDMVTLAPDTSPLAIRNSRNSFTTGDGVVQELYLIDAGQIMLEFAEDDTIGGVIEVSGTNTYDGSQGGYVATLRGALRGTTSDESGGQTDQ